mgnify:CR=1 FL=1
MIYGSFGSKQPLLHFIPSKFDIGNVDLPLIFLSVSISVFRVVLACKRKTALVEVTLKNQGGWTINKSVSLLSTDLNKFLK